MDPGTRVRFDSAVASLESLQRGTVATSDELLSGKWELLWTTEKETLYILKWAKLFTAAGAGGVAQVRCEGDPSEAFPRHGVQGEVLSLP